MQICRFKVFIRDYVFIYVFYMQNFMFQMFDFVIPFHAFYVSLKEYNTNETRPLLLVSY